MPPPQYMNNTCPAAGGTYGDSDPEPMRGDSVMLGYSTPETDYRRHYYYARHSPVPARIPAALIYFRCAQYNHWEARQARYGGHYKANRMRSKHKADRSRDAWLAGSTSDARR